MYYLSVVEIFGKNFPIGTYYSAEEGPKAVNMQETAKFYLISNDSLDDFKKYVSKHTRDHIFYSAATCQYEASIYQFDTLSEIQEILDKVPHGYDVTWNVPEKIDISAPKVASAKSVIPEEICEFEIDWN